MLSCWEEIVRGWGKEKITPTYFRHVSAYVQKPSSHLHMYLPFIAHVNFKVNKVGAL